MRTKNQLYAYGNVNPAVVGGGLIYFVKLFDCLTNSDYTRLNLSHYPFLNVA